MATIKLQIEEFEQTDYCIIAIHTALEDYRLAYFLNKVLKINLSSTENAIEIKVDNDEGHFSRFIFEDQENDIFWNLIQNKSEIELTSKSNTNSLFSNEFHQIDSTVYLLPEYKNVDYLLKIENIFDAEFDAQVVSKLKEIDKISLVYLIDKEKIKSKNNLIF